MEQRNPYRRKMMIVLLLALLIHACIMLFLFVWKSQNAEYERKTQLSHEEREQIVYMQDEPQEETKQQEAPQKEEWAAMKARASDFGGTPLFADEPEFTPEPAAENQEPLTQPTPESPQKEEEKTPEQQNSKPDQEIKKKEQEKSTTVVQDNEEKTAEQKIVEPEKKQESPKIAQRPTKKESAITGTMVGTSNRDATPAPISLADITKGFIRHLTNDGNDSITMSGKEGGNPTAEQLRYSRYLQKLSWWLNNADKVHNHKLNNQPAMKAELQMHMTLKRDGSLIGLEIAQSSGKKYIDEYALFIFRDASVSFPPVPSHIQDNPFKILFTVKVHIGQAKQSFGFSLQ
ncbi:MAG: TonB C-terminal domain-containing protein [Candidatus Dependentiae bacterium]|nr:TonB C-terminal domain-containing protein [Candidatus Dependentiae bacterium]